MTMYSDADILIGLIYMWSAYQLGKVLITLKR